MITTAIVWGVSALLGLATMRWLATSIMIVKEKQEVVLQSFGKYSETRKAPGIQLKKPWPFQDVATRVSTAMVEAKEDLQTKTKDDIFVTLPIKMHLQVCDTKKYVYDSNNPGQQVMSRVAASVKQLTSQMEFAELYQSREKISDDVRKNVGHEIENLYGMRLVDVIVDEPHAPKEIQDSYNNVKASERNKLATNNDAEAQKIRTIKDAEARKEALKLDGEGIAAQRSAIFQNYADQFNNLAQKGMSREEAHEVILAAMHNDTVRDAAKHGNVILTSVAGNDNLGQVGQVVAANKELKKKPPEAGAAAQA